MRWNQSIDSKVYHSMPWIAKVKCVIWVKERNDMDADEVSRVSAMFSAPVWLGQIILCLRTWRK